MKWRKTVPMTEFEEVFERRWEPVVLVGDAVPQFAKNIPARAILARRDHPTPELEAHE